jgi:hypothetical protein
MNLKRLAACAALLALGALQAWAAEPLVGRWQMISQSMGGRGARPLPVAIRITQNGTALEFTYLMGAMEEVTMSFTVRLDGSEAPVLNGKGAPMGAARLTKSGEKYTLIMQSPGRPPEPGTMTVTNKGAILHCESDAMVPGQGATHIVQEFARQ